MRVGIAVLILFVLFSYLKFILDDEYKIKNQDWMVNQLLRE